MRRRFGSWIARPRGVYPPQAKAPPRMRHFRLVNRRRSPNEVSNATALWILDCAAQRKRVFCGLSSTSKSAAAHATFFGWSIGGAVQMRFRMRRRFGSWIARPRGNECSAVYPPQAKAPPRMRHFRLVNRRRSPNEVSNVTAFWILGLRGPEETSVLRFILHKQSAAAHARVIECQQAAHSI